MAASAEAQIRELQRLRRALTEISTLLEAIQKRPQFMLRCAADALDDAITTAPEAEDRFVSHFAFAVTSSRNMAPELKI